jgi:hypothetical protein
MGHRSRFAGNYFPIDRERVKYFTQIGQKRGKPEDYV